jgi:Zn-dependent metalloprotease
MRMTCGCQIVPPKLIDRLARDRRLDADTRRAFADTGRVEALWRGVRGVQSAAALAQRGMPRALAAPLARPAVSVYDCEHGRSLPGRPISNPARSTDRTARRTFVETTAVAKFYRTCFGRNSVDNEGMTLLSSIHYGRSYNNAFWDGRQMTYGDGDGQIFLDFTLSNDVIAHELTHGVTQFSAGLEYQDQPGALNESVSDVFGSMFRQWRAKQGAEQADWLIGADIMGPAAVARGYACLRDMAQPAAKHCLSPQPAHMRDYVPGGDPHDNSGIPNRAFHLCAMALGGRSWQRAGKLWYAALTHPQATPSLGFSGFAKLTRQAATALFAAEPAVLKAVNAAWKTVGVK